MVKYRVSTPKGNCFVTEENEGKAVQEAVKRKYGRLSFFRALKVRLGSGTVHYDGVVTVKRWAKEVEPRDEKASITVIKQGDNGKATGDKCSIQEIH